MSGLTRGSSAFDVALAVWRRRRRLGAVIACTMLAGVATLALSLPDMYRSTATLLVEHREPPEAGARAAGPPVTGELETRLHTITEEVLSRARLEALMARFDLYPEIRAHGFNEAAVKSLWNDIRVKQKAVEPGPGRPTTIAFSVSFRGRDPETVARVANALASFYIDENLKLREVANLARLKQELAQMRQIYSNQYPDVMRLKAEIAAGEQRLSAGLTDASARRAGVLSVQERVGADKTRSDEFRILDPAIPSGDAVAPNRVRLTLVGVLLTVVATVAAVLLAERLDTSFHTPDDLRAFTTVPVLAGIPRLATAADARPQRQWRTAASLVVSVAFVVVVSYYVARGNEWLVWILARGAS